MTINDNCHYFYATCRILIYSDSHCIVNSRNCYKIRQPYLLKTVDMNSADDHSVPSQTLIPFVPPSSQTNIQSAS